MSISTQNEPARPEDYLPKPKSKPEIVETFITFGSQYGRDPERSEIHPLEMSGHGYAVIEAPSYEIGRAIAFAIFNRQFAFVYGAEEWHDKDDDIPHWYPEGELLRIRWVDREQLASEARVRETALRVGREAGLIGEVPAGDRSAS